MMQTRIFQGIGQLSPQEWNRLTPRNFPFARHEFLLALENGQSVGPGTGWSPFYPTLWEGDRLTGATCLFEKQDSFGEFIFDWEWAQAYLRYGIPYYPKTVAAIPFTPATGSKLFYEGEAGSTTIREGLIHAAREWVEERGSSGLHFLFIPPAELPIFEKAGFLLRHSYQFHWENRGYRDFGDFLDALKRKRRQAIGAERRRVNQAGIEILTLSGPELTPELAHRMYRFSQNTFMKKNGTLPYLGEGFYEEVFRTMPENILLIAARKGREFVAGAIHYFQGDSLFGRYWGCLEEYRFLHFEVCYYQAIEFAIRKALRLFEAGAGGEHKLQRGFLPRLTYSAHWLRHAGFSKAIERFVAEERRWVARELDALGRHDPYRLSWEGG